MSEAHRLLDSVVLDLTSAFATTADHVSLRRIDRALVVARKLRTAIDALELANKALAIERDGALAERDQAALVVSELRTIAYVNRPRMVPS